VEIAHAMQTHTSLLHAVYNAPSQSQHANVNPETTPAERAAIEELRKRAQELMDLSEDVHDYATHAVETTELQVADVATEVAIDLLRSAREQLLIAQRSAKYHHALDIAIKILDEIISNPKLTDIERSTKLKTVDEMLFESPRTPSVERAIELVDSAMREVDIAATERALAHIARSPNVARAIRRLRKVALSPKGSPTNTTAPRLSRREQLLAVEQVIADLGDDTHGDLKAAVSLVEDIRKSLMNVRTTISREEQKVGEAIQSLMRAPQTHEIKLATELVRDVERRLADPLADTKLTQRELASAERLLRSSAAGGSSDPSIAEDEHVRKAWEALRSARHDEEIDEARSQVELALASHEAGAAEDALLAAQQRLALIQENSLMGKLSRAEVIAELEDVKNSLMQLPQEFRTTRVDHAEVILDHIFKDLRLDEEHEAHGYHPRADEVAAAGLNAGRLLTDHDIVDEDDRLAHQALLRATEGLSNTDVPGTHSARKALEEALEIIDQRRKFTPSTHAGSHEQTEDYLRRKRESILRSQTRVRQALEDLEKSPQVPSTKIAETELKNALDYLEHELALLALGQGQDGKGTHSDVVRKLIEHSNAAIQQARLEGDTRVTEAEQLLREAVEDAMNPELDPSVARSKIESAERLLAAAALSHTESEAMRAALQDQQRVRELKELERAQKALREEAEKAAKEAAATGGTDERVRRRAKGLEKALREVEDAQEDLRHPGRSSYRQTRRKLERAKDALVHYGSVSSDSVAKASDMDVDALAAHPELKSRPTDYAYKFLHAVAARLEKIAESAPEEGHDGELSEKDKELLLAADLVRRIHEVGTLNSKHDLLSRLEELKLEGMSKEDRARLLSELENRLIELEPTTMNREIRTVVDLQLQRTEVANALEELNHNAIKDDPHVQEARKELEHVLSELDEDLRRARENPAAFEEAQRKRLATKARIRGEQQLEHAHDAIAAAAVRAESGGSSEAKQALSKAAEFVVRVRKHIKHPIEEQSADEKALNEAADLVVEIAKAKKNQHLAKAEELFHQLRKVTTEAVEHHNTLSWDERATMLKEISIALRKAQAEDPSHARKLARAERLANRARVGAQLHHTAHLINQLPDAHSRVLSHLRSRVAELEARLRRQGDLSDQSLGDEVQKIAEEVDSLPAYATHSPAYLGLRSFVHDMAQHALESAAEPGRTPEEEIAEAIEELNHMEETPEIRAAKEVLSEVLHKMRLAHDGGVGSTHMNQEELQKLLQEASEKLANDPRQHDPHLHRAKQLLDLAEAQREVDAAMSIIVDAAKYSPALMRALALLREAHAELDDGLRGKTMKETIVREIESAARRIERSGIQSDDLTVAARHARRAIDVLRRHDDELLAQRHKDLDKVEELLKTLHDLPQLPGVGKGASKVNTALMRKKRSELIAELQQQVQKARQRRPGDAGRHLILPAMPTEKDLGLGLSIDEYQDCANAPGHHLAGRQCVPDAVCTETSCNHHGVCSVLHGSIHCTCDPGFVTVGKIFCSACASRSATYPDCYTRDLTDEYIRDSLSPEACHAPLLPTTLNGPGMLHTALRTVHIQDKYFINTAVNSHAIRIVVPEESLLRVHVYASHTDLLRADRPISLKLALPDLNMVVHQGTKFFGQQETALAAILAPNIAYSLVFEYDGKAIAQQAAERGESCPTMRVDIAVTSATTLTSYLDTALNDALLENAHAPQLAPARSSDGGVVNPGVLGDMHLPGIEHHISLPSLGLDQGEGVPQHLVEAIARGEVSATQLAAHAAGHGGCTDLPQVPIFPVDEKGVFHVPPAGYFRVEKLAVLTGVTGRGQVLDHGPTGATTGPSAQTNPDSGEIDFDMGVENAIYMLPFTIPHVDGRHAYIEVEIEFNFIYGDLRLMLRSDTNPMLFMGHASVNTNRIRVPVVPGKYTIVVMLLKPHPAPVPTHPLEAFQLDENMTPEERHRAQQFIAQQALATVTMPDCMIYSLKFKADFVEMPELPPGERLTSQDILSEDCQFSQLPPHLNVPGLMGYHGRRLHLFETFKYNALRSVRYVNFEIAEPSVIRIHVPPHQNLQDLQIRLVRRDHPFVEAAYERQEKFSAAGGDEFEDDPDDPDAIDDVYDARGRKIDREKRLHARMQKAKKLEEAEMKRRIAAGSDVIVDDDRKHISQKRRRTISPDSKLVSIGIIRKPSLDDPTPGSDSIVADLEPGAYRLDVLMPRTRVIPLTETQCEGFTMELTILPRSEAENMSHAQCRSSAPHAPVIPRYLHPGINVPGAKESAPVTEFAGSADGSAHATGVAEDDLPPEDIGAALMAATQVKEEAMDQRSLYKLRKTAKAKSLQYSYVAHVPRSRWNSRKPIVTWQFWVSELPPGEKGLQIDLELEYDFSRAPLLAVLEESLEEADKHIAQAKAADAAARHITENEGRAFAPHTMQPKSALEVADEILEEAQRAKHEGWPATVAGKNYQTLRRILTPGLYRLALYLVAPGPFERFAAEHLEVEEDFACIEYDLRFYVTSPSKDPSINRCLQRTPVRPGLLKLPRSFNTLRFLGSDMLATQGELSGRFILPRLLHHAKTTGDLVQQVINDDSHERPYNAATDPNYISKVSVSSMEIVLPAASLLRVALDAEGAPVALKLVRHKCLVFPGEPPANQPIGSETRVQPWGKYDMQREMGRWVPGCMETILDSASGRFTHARFLDPGLYELIIEQSEMTPGQELNAAADCEGYDLQLHISGLHALEAPEVLPDRIFPPEVLMESSRLAQERLEFARKQRRGVLGKLPSERYGDQKGEDPEADAEEEARELRLHPNYRPHAMLAELNPVTEFVPLCPNLGSDHLPPAPPSKVKQFWFYDSVRRNEHLHFQLRHKQPRIYTMRFSVDHSFRLYSMVGYHPLISHLTLSLTALGGLEQGLLEYNGRSHSGRHILAVDVAPKGEWLLTLAEASTPIEQPDNLGIFCAYFTFKLEIEPLPLPPETMVPAALGIPPAYLLLSALQRVLPRYPPVPFTLNSPAFLVPHHQMHHFGAYSLLPAARHSASVAKATLFNRNQFKFVLYHKTLVRILVTPAVRHFIDAHFSVRILLDCDACDALEVAHQVTVHNTRVYSWMFGTLQPGSYSITLHPRTSALPHTYYLHRGALDVQLEMAMAPVETILKALPHPCPFRVDRSTAVCEHVERMWVQRPREQGMDALTITEEKALCARHHGKRVYTLTFALAVQSTISVATYFDFLMTTLMPNIVDLVNEHRWHAERMMNSFQLYAVLPAGYYNLTLDSLGHRAQELLHDSCLRDTYGLSVHIAPNGYGETNVATSGPGHAHDDSWTQIQLLAHGQRKRGVDAGSSLPLHAWRARSGKWTGPEVTEEEQAAIWATIKELQDDTAVPDHRDHKVGGVKISIRHEDARSLRPDLGEVCPNPTLPEFLLPLTLRNVYDRNQYSNAGQPNHHRQGGPYTSEEEDEELAYAEQHARPKKDNKAREFGETEAEAYAYDQSIRAERAVQPVALTVTPGLFARLAAPRLRAMAVSPSSPLASGTSFDGIISQALIHGRPEDVHNAAMHVQAASRVDEKTAQSAAKVADRLMAGAIDPDHVESVLHRDAMGRESSVAEILQAYGDQMEDPDNGKLHTMKIRSTQESLLIIDLRSNSGSVPQQRHAQVWSADALLNIHTRADEQFRGKDLVPRQVYHFRKGRRDTRLFWLPTPKSKDGSHHFILQFATTYANHDFAVKHELNDNTATTAAYQRRMRGRRPDPNILNERDLVEGRSMGDGDVALSPCITYDAEITVVPVAVLAAKLLPLDTVCEEVLPAENIPFDARGKAAVRLSNGIWHSGMQHELRHTRVHRMRLHVMEASVLSAGFKYPFAAASFRLVLYKLEDDGHTYEIYRARPRPVIHDAQGQFIDVVKGVPGGGNGIEVPLDRAVSMDAALELNVRLEPGNYYLEIQEQLSTVVHAILSKLITLRAKQGQALGSTDQSDFDGHISKIEREHLESEAQARVSRPLCVPYMLALELTPTFLIKEHGKAQLLPSLRDQQPPEVVRSGCQAHTCGCRNIDVFSHVRAQIDANRQNALYGSAGLAIPEARMPTGGLLVSSLSECTSTGVCVPNSDGNDRAAAAVTCHCAEGYAGARCEYCANGYVGYPDCRPAAARVEEEQGKEEVRSQLQESIVEASDPSLNYDQLLPAPSIDLEKQHGWFSKTIPDNVHEEGPHSSNEHHEQEHEQSETESHEETKTKAVTPFRLGTNRPAPKAPPVPPLPPMEFHEDSTGFSGTPIIVPTVPTHSRYVSPNDNLMPAPGEEIHYCDRPCYRGRCDYRTGKCVTDLSYVTPEQERIMKELEKQDLSSSLLMIASKQQGKKLEELREKQGWTGIGGLFSPKLVAILAALLGLGVIFVIYTYLRSRRRRVHTVSTGYMGQLQSALDWVFDNVQRALARVGLMSSSDRDASRSLLDTGMGGRVNPGRGASQANGQQSSQAPRTGFTPRQAPSRLRNQSRENYLDDDDDESGDDYKSSHTGLLGDRLGLSRGAPNATPTRSYTGSDSSSSEDIGVAARFAVQIAAATAASSPNSIPLPASSPANNQPRDAKRD